MSDNPMYWPGHQRPMWHQQAGAAAAAAAAAGATTAPPNQVNSMGHYSTGHPSSMLAPGGPMPPNPSSTNMGGPSNGSDPSSAALQMQSNIPPQGARHQATPQQQASHQQQGSQGGPQNQPPPPQSNLYSSMMPVPGAGGAGGGSAGVQPSQQQPPQPQSNPNIRQQMQASNSHLAASSTTPSHLSMQPSTHPQSHSYPHQYSALASSYWNTPSMSAGATTTDISGTYHSAPAMANDSRTANISSNAQSARAQQQQQQQPPTMQQSASSFHNPKDLQSSSDHLMPMYDRQLAPPMSAQQQTQQHPSSVMPQGMPNSAAANNPTNAQGRLPMSQSSQWSNSYYGQQSHSPYSSVMNPYMPYGSSGVVPNHGTTGPPRAGLNSAPTKMPPSNGSDRSRPPTGYSTHTNLYVQPPQQTSGSSNGAYYGYDPYYNQMTSQAPDPYSLSHSSSSSHWLPPTAGQMMSNSSPAPTGPIQPPSMRPQSGASMHPQSPSASLPTVSTRPTPQPASQTPDRSPAPQHSATSYPSPNQQGTAKSTSNSLAQLEQMVMPGGGAPQGVSASTLKSPTHRSSTSSPGTNQPQPSQQQQMQYSYNSTGPSYMSNASTSNNMTSGYYSQYDSSGGVDMPKTSWQDQSSSQMPMGSAPGSMMGDSTGSYRQTSYESTPYSEYTPLTTPSQARFPPTGDTSETQPEKSDPYAIDSQTFDDYDERATPTKAKKTRAKKADDGTKKERKPRAPRAPKVPTGTSVQGQPPQSPSASTLQSHPHIKPPQPQSSNLPQVIPEPMPPQMTMPGMPSDMVPPSLPPPSNVPMESDSIPTGPMSIGSPSRRLSSDIPSGSMPHGPPNAFVEHNSTSLTDTPSMTATNQNDYYTQDQSVHAAPKPWPDQTKVETELSSGMSAGLSSMTTNDAASSSIMDNNVVEPAQTEVAQPSYEHPKYDTSSFGDYTPLTAPMRDIQHEPALGIAPIDSDSNVQLDTRDQASILEPQVSEEASASKSKKSRSKKNADDTNKRERKTRSSKAKAGTVSATQLEADGSQTKSLESTPLPEETGLQTDNNLGTFSRSPMHRLSTDSPTQSQHQIPTHQAYNSQYDPSLAGEASKNSWSDNQQLSTLHSSQTEHIPNHGDSTHSYSDYAQLAGTNAPDSVVKNDNLEGQVDGSQQGDEKSKSKSKPKRPRPKRTDSDKPKKERKSRAKVPPAPTQLTEQPSTPPTTTEAEVTEETTEPQQLADATPTESKPKRIRIRDSGSRGKKKLPKFALKFAKTKRRKRLGSSDNDQSDLEKTPPPSPDEMESGVQKRRSARNTKKLKYNEDIELGFSDSDDENQARSRSKKSSDANQTTDGEGADETTIADEPTVYAAPVEDTMVVEKIMASRIGKRELEPEPGEVLPPDQTHIDVEEFYVKYKNLSYLHCDWRTMEELEKGDRRVVQKLKRYKQKKDSSNMFSFMDEEPFDPQYCEVDRILALNEVEEMVPESEDEEESDKDKSEPTEQPAISSDTNVKAIEDSVEVPVNNETPMEVENTVPKDIVTDTIESEKNVDETDLEMEAKATTQTIPDANQTQADQPSTNISETDARDEPKPLVDKSEGQNEDDNKKDEAEVSVTGDQNVDSVSESKDEKSVSVIDQDDQAMQVDQTQTDELKDKDSEESEIKPRKMKKKISRHFLVKWRGLSYEESTWELGDDLDPDKIAQFMRFKDPPPKSKWRPVKRPKPEEWARKEASPVYKNNNTLREYQLEGINWLSFCWHQGRNCILADEMGLGKTIQSIAFINEIYEHGINGPFLIIVPLSTVGNWAREFETWTDLNVITYHGSSTSREMLKEYEMYYRNEQGNRITGYYKFQVMITTFEIILSDCLELREIPWRCCIIDEAHRLKNRNCKLLEGLRLLNMEHRVLLTGTPLQNNVEELFSLLNFLEPTQFSSTEQFLQEFGDLKTESQVEKLKLILKPMMLRRLKEDVEKSLAPKEETIVEVELTNIQKKYYRAILERNFSFLSKGSTNNNMPNLMNTMMELRKCCIHPYLINGAEEQILYEAKQSRLSGGQPISSHQAMVNASGKLVLIDKLLPRLRADGHRVLIFSQMVRCLDILEDYVTQKHYPYERIDGRVRGGDRQQAIDRFSKPGSDRFVFLLCTRAGGLGINLTAADTVIIFDSDWNPQNDLQAQARCHRIGQSKAVKIYRLICRNTYEREMFDKASLKLGLDKAVLQSMNTQKSAGGGVDGQLTKKEIEELLRKGAYGALMDDDNAGDKFCEEDIDHILQRRTQVITIDNSEAKGSTFSKATFSSSNNREDIELDDPNFWEKWAKKANIDTDDMLMKDELIQLAPRRRTQTKRYGADGNLLDISDLDSSDEDEETISMRTRGSRGRQPKTGQSSSIKKSKRHRFDDDDDDLPQNIDGGYWSRSDCLKLESGLLTHGWGRWGEIMANNLFKRDISIDDCENICRVILLYCLNSYKGDEKIKNFVWDLIVPPEEAKTGDASLDSSQSSRGRKPKSAPVTPKKPIADEISDADWPKDAKYDPLIALPDDQYRRHLQRNCNRILIRVRLLHYLKYEIFKDQYERILNDCNIGEIDFEPFPVDGELPASWWDDESDLSLLVGIFKHGHDKFNLMRQDPCLCFLQRCGPPNKDELIAEMNASVRNVEDGDDENRDPPPINLRRTEAGKVLDDLLNAVVRELSGGDEKENESYDENKNTIMRVADQNESMDELCDTAIGETTQTTKMDITDEESLTNENSIDTTLPETVLNNSSSADANELLPFPHPNDLNQRFRRLITAHQRNSKKLEIKMAQKARDELKKERTSKFEAARSEREERKRSLAQKWSRREESDFTKAISFFGVEYDPVQQRHDWNKFRAIGRLDKKMDETLEDYYRAFVAMCKRVTNRPLSEEEERCELNIESINEDRASKCLARIEFFSKIREVVLVHPELDERLMLCNTQSDLPDWWENGRHDRDLLVAAAKHGLYRLDYNLAFDSSLSFDEVIKQRVENLFANPPSSILIPLEQLQELLERNGIEYSKDIDTDIDDDEVRAVIESLLASVETDSPLDSTQAIINMTETPYKLTRSSTLSVNTRGANIRRSLGSSDSNHGDNSVRLTSVKDSTKAGRRVAEVTPVLPDRVPEDLKKTHEAGELTVTVLSESALLKLDDRPPMVLLGALNPITIKIRWPKDKAIQTRLENLISLVERNEWPMPPKPMLPTITLPNHLATSTSTPMPLLSQTPPINSPSKASEAYPSLGSPGSDVSNVSSKLTSDSRDRSLDPTSMRGRRGRGRKPRLPDPNELPSGMSHLDSPRDDRQAAAKLRNLLSQGSSSTRGQSATPDKSKASANKQGPGLSSLLASFKQKSRDLAGGSSRGRDDKNLFDLGNQGAANLLPQILANMKPEFRDLLANQDAATMLINSLSNLTGPGMAGSGQLPIDPQMLLDNLLNPNRSSSTSTKGPPPAHQSNPPPTAHGSSTSRELRSNTQVSQEVPSPSINLRPNRGKGTLEFLSQQKATELALSSMGKLSSGKRRGRPSGSSGVSESPPNLSASGSGADVLDLSSLTPNEKPSSASRSDSRLRRHRDPSEDSTASIATRSGSSVPTKANLKASTRQPDSSQFQESDSQDRGDKRSTRASKRIGSRIDALALNLQAKRLHRSDSPGSDLSPSIPKDIKQSDKPMAAHGGRDKQSTSGDKATKAPPAAHSGSHKSSNSSLDRQSRTSSGPSQTSTSSPLSSQPSGATQQSRQDPMAQLMSNPSSLLAGFNPSTLSSAGELMNQLLRKAGSNDIVKNLLNEFMKNPSLALDPNILATLTATLPLGGAGLPSFNLPGQTPATALPSMSSNITQPSKSSPMGTSSLLNDFKSPSGNSLMKRSKDPTTTTSSSARPNTSSSSPSLTTSTDARRTSSSSTSSTNTSSSDRHGRRSGQSSDRRSLSSSNYPERSERSSKQDKRNGSTQDTSPDANSSRRSSSSLLAQQVSSSQQTSQAQTSATSTLSQPSLPTNSASLNLANQFGNLGGSLSSLLNFPGMSELMKQMGNFPGLAGNLPSVPATSMPNTSTASSNNMGSSGASSNDKSSRRSRQSTASSMATSAANPTSLANTTLTNQQAANAALASSFMNLAASQPNSAANNPYANYTNPLANPFLPFNLGNLGNLANLGMNNPLGMGALFPNLYMPPGFPVPGDQRQQQQQQQQSQQPPSSQASGSMGDSSSRDKKMRYPRK